MKPAGWFGNSTTNSSSSWTQSVTDTGRGIGNQFKTMGTTVSSAVGKAKTAVASTFTPRKDGDLDPQTSLASMPDKNSLGAEIWVANGQVFEMKGNYVAAMNEYTKALEKEPDNLAALQAVARLQLRQEQYDNAVASYQKVVKVGPTAENYSELGSAQQKAGKLQDAQASLRQAVTLDSGVPRYRNNLAGVLVAMGRSDEAVAELQQIFPPAVANYNVAYLHYLNKNMAATQQHLQSALQADPNLQQARDLMALISKSQAGQSAVATVGVANQVYQTYTNKPQVNTVSTPSSFNGPGATSTPANSPAPQYSPQPNMPTMAR
jgi:tetratricopeptide (TPR) repeat protein